MRTWPIAAASGAIVQESEHNEDGELGAILAGHKDMDLVFGDAEGSTIFGEETSSVECCAAYARLLVYLVLWTTRVPRQVVPSSWQHGCGLVCLGMLRDAAYSEIKPLLQWAL